jgi:hypothetical protein
MIMGHFSAVPPVAITRVLSTFDRRQLEGFVAVAIDLMDFADGDPDAEHDPLNEGDPAFRPEDRAMANEHPRTDPNADAEPAAWTERVDQSKGIAPELVTWGIGSCEDAEDDDPGGGNVDDEPHDPEEDRCSAGDDWVKSGPVVFCHGAGLHVGSDDDHEPGNQPPETPFVTEGCEG